MAAVKARFHPVFFQRLPEARPARTGFELGIGAEQRFAATHAFVSAMLLGVPVPPTESRLRALLPGHVVLIRRELLAPFGIGLGNFVGHFFVIDGSRESGVGSQEPVVGKTFARPAADHQLLTASYQLPT